MAVWTISEYQDRLAASYAARTRADTTDVLADLPTEPIPAGAPAAGPNGHHEQGGRRGH